MKSALVEDLNNPTLRSLTRGVLTTITLEKKNIPFIVAFDSTTLHYKPWSTIVINPKVKSAWKAIVERYFCSDAYKALNEAVSNDPLLSKYATVNFLNTLFKKSREMLPRIKPGPGPGPKPEELLNPISALIQLLDTQVSSQASGDAINAIVQGLEAEARETLEDIEAIQSFSHFGAPVEQFLENPDEFRNIARNRIIVNLVKFLRKLRREASPKFAKAPTLVGGRPLGVKRIQRWSELPRTLLTEYADDDIFEYKVASRTLRVSLQYGGIPDYVVYLDKSGSMAGGIKNYISPTHAEYVPKISFAAASALALAHQLKKVGSKLTLKLFDTEVHDPVTDSDFAQLIKVLMTIRADSGTSISNVLEDSLNYRDDRIIIITDGIDEVSEESVKKAKSANLDITVVFIQTDNELLRKNFKHIHLQEAKPNILLQI